MDRFALCDVKNQISSCLLFLQCFFQKRTLQSLLFYWLLFYWPTFQQCFSQLHFFLYLIFQCSSYLLLFFLASLKLLLEKTQFLFKPTYVGFFIEVFKNLHQTKIYIHVNESPMMPMPFYDLLLFHHLEHERFVVVPL